MKADDQTSDSPDEPLPTGSESTRSALGILATKYALLPISLVISIAVARILGPEDRGVFAIILLISDTFLPMVAFGSTGGLRYFVSSKKYEPGGVVLSSAVMGIIQGVVGFVLLTTLWRHELLGELTSGVSLDLLMPVLLVLPLTGINQHFGRLIVGASWFTEVNIAQFARQLVNPLVLGVFVLLLDGGIEGAAMAMVAREVLNLIINAVLILRKVSIAGGVNWQFIGKSFHYGIRGWLGGLARLTNTRMDQLILVAVATKSQLGVYAIAVRIVELLGMTVHSFGMVLFNRISGATSRTQQSRVMEQVHRASFLGMTVAGAIVAAFSPVVIPWALGDAFDGTVTVLLILLPGAVATATWRLISGYFGATEAPFISSLGQILALFVTIPGMLILLPKFGVAGAAAASTIAYFVAGLVMVLLYRRDQKPRKPRLFAVDRADLHWMVERVTGALQVWRKMATARMKRH